MELDIVEELRHTLSLEVGHGDDECDALEGMYMDDGVDWWPYEDVKKGDLKELSYKVSSTRMC